MSRVTNIERVGHEYVIDATHRGVSLNGQRFPVRPLRRRTTDEEWLALCCEKACLRVEVAAQSLPNLADEEDVPVPDTFTVDQQRLT